VTEVTWEQSATAAGSEEQRNSWPSNVGRGEEGGRRREEEVGGARNVARDLANCLQGTLASNLVGGARD
jgi:hypothetical protein